ncbi:MAG: SAM-dependent methyltransferase [Rickettsiaceae bacterium]|nr:SAM-dependent methyltransferase [Rickettsiaceae bacterium]
MPKNIIKLFIEKNGFITVEDFMKKALIGSSNAYYKSRNPFDKKSGDFITSPEISQMFGEIVAVWVYNRWLFMGTPKSLSLVELGAGSGILMRDILRVLSKTEIFHGLKIYILEINPVLVAIQQNELKDYLNNIVWISNAQEFPEDHSIYIANEFFDSLPTKQYIKQDGLWHERVITLNDGDLFFGTIQVDPRFSKRLSEKYKNTKDGSIVEISQETIRYFTKMIRNMSRFKSCGLVIDYGYYIKPLKRKEHEFKDSLQAVKSHKYCPVFDDIGRADITTHVDFFLLRECSHFYDINSKIWSQRDFLLKHGMEIRLKDLAKKNPEYKDVLENQFSRLTDKGSMGGLFKVLEVYS